MEFHDVCEIISQCMQNNQYLQSYTSKDNYETENFTNIIKDLLYMVTIALKYKDTLQLIDFDPNNDVHRIMSIVILCYNYGIKTCSDIDCERFAQNIGYKFKEYHEFVAHNDLIYYYTISSNNETTSLSLFFTRVIYYEKNQGLIKEFHALKDNDTSNEYKMYHYMRERHSSFSTYKNHNKYRMIMHWDRKLIKYSDYALYCKHYDLYNIGNLLNVMDVMRKNNFFHGDFKSANILINPLIHEIQIIDLQHGKILSDMTRIDSWDACFNYFDYTDDDFDKYEIYFSKRIFYLYDMYKLVTTVNYDSDRIWNMFKHSKNEVHLDFMVMCRLHDNNTKWVTTIFDMKEMLNLPIINHHHEKIRNIVNKEIIRNKPNDPVL